MICICSRSSSAGTGAASGGGSATEPALSLGRVAMGSGVTGTLDEAYQRLHATGPEFDGWLSNHGPMAAEAMVRHGHADRVQRWLDVYMRRLEEFPRGSGPIGSDWREALGDVQRIADWTSYFRREVAEQLTELAHGLAYWAARWQPVPGARATEPPLVPAPGVAGELAGAELTAADSLTGVPRVADQSGGIDEGLDQLAALPGWPAALAAPKIPGSAQPARSWLVGLVDAATFNYLRYGHGEA